MLDLVTAFILPIALFIMMLGVGSTIHSHQLAVLVHRRGMILAGVGSMALAGPLLAFCIARILALPNELAIGLILLASCPGGLFSNYLTLLSRGEIGLSVCLTAVVSLIYVATGPMWAEWALLGLENSDKDVSVPYTHIMRPLVLFLLLPICLGMVLRGICSSKFRRVLDVFPDLGGVLAIFCYVIIVYAQRDTIVDGLVTVLPAVVILNLLLILLCIGLSYLFKLSWREFTALCIEHLIRQEGTGIYIAIAFVGSLESSLPMLVNSLTGLFFSSLIIVFGRRRLPLNLRKARRKMCSSQGENIS